MVKFEISQVNRFRIIKCRGQMSYLEKLEIDNLLNQEKKLSDLNYVLELNDVYYIDSYGISLIQKLAALKDKSINLFIVVDKDYIDYILRFTKIDLYPLIKIVSSMQEVI